MVYQSIDVNGSFSYPLPDIPQGTCLGPLLFIVYAYRLPLSLLLNAHMFVDDTTITGVAKIYDYICRPTARKRKKIKEGAEVKFLGTKIQNNLSWLAYYRSF